VDRQSRAAIMRTMALESLRRYRREILDAAERHGARSVRVFGAMARGDDHQESDVDFLVDIEPGRTLLDVIALMLEQDLTYPALASPKLPSNVVDMRHLPFGRTSDAQSRR
jgi:predicted nucleotidyltransferase